ncbi:uncharacterized protein LOC129003073 isoform X2 [Macrosteles quadrilineatus]|uniref:uncharacterized protein LOC129003073 isoform X2 n=1 Tax=Macrosteles quadrilineatus TaxID=74068 RepID=UPI0023E32E6B|nr:uncharacterized protein LOC129003073 isoform X2 [Macrosteles quadrilineatus]
MCANWTANNRDMSPDRHGHYQLDNVGLQNGLGLPVQLLGANMMNNFYMPRHDGYRGHHSRNQSPRNHSPRDHHRRRHDGPNPPMPLEIKLTGDGIPIRTVYINNISIEKSREDIMDIFSRCGIVYNVYMGLSKNCNQKQFAFVTYVNPLDATRVLNLKRFNGMYVNPADSWHQPIELPDGTIEWRGRKNLYKQEESNELEEDIASEEVPSKVETEIIQGSLNMLNDDCLLHIFSFLTLKETAGVERVCKRWQALSLRMWHCVHELNFNKDNSLTHVFMNTGTLDQYLKRCGPVLTSLYLGNNDNHKFDGAALFVIAKHCGGRLESLGINNIDVPKRSLAHIGRSCPRLKRLSLDGCYKLNDQELAPMLNKLTHLKVLELARLQVVTGKCLTEMKGPVTKLKIIDLPMLVPHVLLSGLEKMAPTLENVALNDCTVFRNNQILAKIVAVVPNITSFCLSHYSSVFYNTSLAPLGQLKKLTSLNLHVHNAVNDNALTAIVEGCEELTNLKLSGSGGEFAGGVSERGISMLARLKKLTHLDISYLEATNDTALKNLTARNCKLQQLDCRGCPSLTDEGPQAVLTLCHELQLFDLSGCEGVTISTVETAVASVKMRTNNIPLRICVGGTEVEHNPSTSYNVPRFTLDFKDTSEEHLRPDFIDDMFFPPSDSDEDDDLDHLCCDCDFDFDDLFDGTLFRNDETRSYGFDDDDDDIDIEDWANDSEEEEKLVAYSEQLFEKWN